MWAGVNKVCSVYVGSVCMYKCVCVCILKLCLARYCICCVCSHISCPYSVTLIYSNTYSIFIDSLHWCLCMCGCVRVCVLSQLATGRNSSAFLLYVGIRSLSRSVSFHSIWRRVKWSARAVRANRRAKSTKIKNRVNLNSRQTALFAAKTVLLPL